MFEAMAKRRLKRDLVQLVQEKGAAWCFQSQLVQDELLQKQPKQQANIKMLCHFVTTDGFISVFSRPMSVLGRPFVERRMIAGGMKGKDARWVMECWVAALASLPDSQRIEIANQIEAQANAQREAAAERRLLLIECWRLSFPLESSAIQQAADQNLEEQAWKAAYHDLSSFGTRRNTLSEEEEKEAKQFVIDNSAQKDRDVDAEIWRRIETAPDQQALQQKLKEHWESGLAQRKIEERRQHYKNLEQRKLQAKVEEQNLQAKAEQQKRQELKQQAEAEERKKMKTAEKEKKAKIKDLRQRFPLQCAGLSDEEVARQIFKKQF